MDTFLVIHQLLGIDLTNVDPYYIVAAQAAGEAADQHGAAFRQCWYDEADGLLVCEWEASSEDAVRETLKAGNIPMESIHRVQHFSMDAVRSILNGAGMDGPG